MMRTIGILFAVMTSIIAQEMKACVNLNWNDGENNYFMGHLVFTQLGSENVKITGDLIYFEPAWYVAVIHEGDEFKNNCDSLGPIAKVDDDTLFDVFSMRIQTRGHVKIHENAISWPTLQPNKPRNIIGRTIAIYDASTFDDSSDQPAIRNVACGYVAHGRECGE